MNKPDRAISPLNESQKYFETKVMGKVSNYTPAHYAQLLMRYYHLQKLVADCYIKQNNREKANEVYNDILKDLNASNFSARFPEGAPDYSEDILELKKVCQNSLQP